MALDLVKIPNSVLFQKAKKIDVFDDKLKEIIVSMRQIMLKHHGVGLAAPQVGLSISLFVIKLTKETPWMTFINPVILEKKGFHYVEEGCLSIGASIIISAPRAIKIKARAQDSGGNFFTVEDDDLLGQCIQHEYDHLMGKTLMDYLSPKEKNKVYQNIIS